MVIFTKNQNKDARRPKVQQARHSTLTTYYRSQKQEDDSPFKRRAPKRNTRKYFFGFLDLLLLHPVKTRIEKRIGLIINFR